MFDAPRIRSTEVDSCFYHEVSVRDSSRLGSHETLVKRFIVEPARNVLKVVVILFDWSERERASASGGMGRSLDVRCATNQEYRG